ncbi:MAG: GtrA family protein [Parvularculaceae bacterium]
MTIARKSDRDTGLAGRHGRRIALFSGVGVVNTITDFVAYAALVGLGAFAPTANVIAFLGANAQSYIVNARITFREAGEPARLTLLGYAKFLGAHIVSLVISTAMIIAFADAIGAIAAKLASFAFTFAWNYAMSAFFVFRPRASVNKPGEVL